MPTPLGSLYPSSNLYPSASGLFTQRLLDSARTWLDAAPTSDLYNYLQALGAMFDGVTALVQDWGFPDDPNYTPGWSVLLDPDNCPTSFLPFLAQFNGTNVQPGTDDANARAIIKAESGFARGTVASIVGAAQRNLTGTRSCVLMERTPNAYAFQVIVRPEEVTSLSAIQNAINAIKPAGLTYAITETDGWIIFQMESSAVSIAALESNFATVNGLENDLPGH